VPRFSILVAEREPCHARLGRTAAVCRVRPAHQGASGFPSTYSPWRWALPHSQVWCSVSRRRSALIRRPDPDVVDRNRREAGRSNRPVMMRPDMVVRMELQSRGIAGSTKIGLYLLCLFLCLCAFPGQPSVARGATLAAVAGGRKQRTPTPPHAA
jgi:hypothetical protein